MIPAAGPRVALRAPHLASPLSAYLVAAYEMLVEAGRVRPASPSAPADLVHTVGDVPPPEPGPLPVRTVETVPLRSGRLAVEPGWLRRERRHGSTATTWLAHGFTAGRLLLDARLAASGRLHCLPLVGTLAPPEGRARAAERATTRARLGLAPGARLVLTTAGGADPWPGAAGRWPRELAAAGRTDIAVMQLSSVDQPGTHLVTDAVTGRRVGSLPLFSMLAGCDLFVTTGRNLVACSPAVTAADWGIPLVATATDSAAELVLTKGVGTVVSRGDVDVARAVLAELDGGLPHATPAARVPAAADRLAECAHSLLGVYRRIMRAAAIGGAA